MSSPVAKVRKNLDKELFSNPQQLSIEPHSLLDGMQRIQYHGSQRSFVNQEQTLIKITPAEHCINSLSSLLRAGMWIRIDRMRIHQI